MLHPHFFAERLTVTLWSRVRGWMHYPINERDPNAKLTPVERERAIVAGLLDGG